MDYTIIIGYFVLLLIQYFAIQAIPITILGGILSRFIGIYPAIVITGTLTWLGINLIWLKVFDKNLPLLAFVLSIGLQLFHLKSAKTDLTGTSKQMIIGEVISIIIIGIYILTFKEFNLF